MNQLAVFLFGLVLLISAANAQQSIDSQNGFDVGKNCGIAIFIYAVTLAVVPLTVNLIKKYMVDNKVKH